MKKKSHLQSSSDSYPVPDGHPTRHRPRRNYWGNLYNEDTFDEDRHNFSGASDSALYDAEDDHDSYYESGNYD